MVIYCESLRKQKLYLFARDSPVIRYSLGNKVILNIKYLLTNQEFAAD